jgi:hypothetical protein
LISLRLDCIISGLSLYTPTLLLVLAYINPGEEEEEAPKGHKSKDSVASTSSEPSGGIRRRQNAVAPELRLIDLTTSEEVETDGLTVSRFERLSASDYHLGVLPAAPNEPEIQVSRGTLDALSGMGSGMWNATVNATTLLGSAASVRSNGSKSDAESSTRTIGASKLVHPHVAAPGLKIFIHSPYDCIIASKRDLSDHLSWLMEQKQYQQAWELVDRHPGVISAERLSEIGPESMERDDFYDDASVASVSLINSAVEKEKRNIGEMWIQQLANGGNWAEAGKICGRVLGTSTRWEHWVWTFAGAKKFKEITDYIPTTQLQPPLPSTIYEVVLGHYIATNRPRVRDLLEKWPPELFDIKTITNALEDTLKYRDVREDSVEDGEKGRDWRIVKESLGKLYVADGRPREALRCFIKLQDADAAMGLIKDFHLADAVADDIPGLVLLRVSKEQEKSAPIEELAELTSDVVELLVKEVGLVKPEVVVKQLGEMPLYLFFYLRSLWRGNEKESLDEFADLAIELFATYDRELLMEFMKTSTSYTFEKVSHSRLVVDAITTYMPLVGFQPLNSLS